MKRKKGNNDLTKKKFAIILSKFNQFITQGLLDGAIGLFKEKKIPEKNINIFKVPGAFEIPVTANKIASLKKYDAIICLGAVIRGDTPHFDYVASSAADGILHVSLKHSLPVIFGVLTTDNLEQAVERAKPGDSNKGREAALTAIEMVELFGKIK